MEIPEGSAEIVEAYIQKYGLDHGLPTILESKVGRLILEIRQLKRLKYSSYDAAIEAHSKVESLFFQVVRLGLKNHQGLERLVTDFHEDLHDIKLRIKENF